MKELKKGKMSYAELADWFGISYDSLRQTATKKKKLEILKYYADFHIAKIGKTAKKTCIVIDNVKEPVYTKVREKYKDWESTWDINKCGMDTVTHAAEEFYDKNPDIQFKIASSTNYKYYGQARREDYGCAIGRLRDGGKKGRSYRVWAQEMGKGKYRPLSKEEIDKIERIKKECGLNLEVGIDAETLMDLKKEYKYMSKEEQDKLKIKLSESLLADCEKQRENYMQYMALIAKELGFSPKRVIVNEAEMDWEDANSD